MITIVALYLGVFSVFALFALGIFYLILNHQAKKEVQVAPRIEMFLCPALPSHGAFPAKHAMKLNVPQDGRPDLQVDMCPFCYNEKMKEAEKIFKV